MKKLSDNTCNQVPNSWWDTLNGYIKILDKSIDSRDAADVLINLAVALDNDTEYDWKEFLINTFGEEYIAVVDYTEDKTEAIDWKEVIG